jgi:hypothetical protein
VSYKVKVSYAAKWATREGELQTKVSYKVKVSYMV